MKHSCTFTLNKGSLSGLPECQKPGRQDDATTPDGVRQHVEEDGVVVHVLRPPIYCTDSWPLRNEQKDWLYRYRTSISSSTHLQLETHWSVSEQLK